MALVREVIDIGQFNKWVVPQGVYWVNLYSQQIQKGDLALGNGFAMALQPDWAAGGYGRLWAWGSNATGLLGDGTLTPKSSPVAILGAQAPIANIAAGNLHTMACTIYGDIYTWGANIVGQLGNNTVTSASSAVLITTAALGLGSTRWLKVAAGGQNSYALRSDGRVFGWGAGNFGAIGDNTLVAKSTPVQIIAGGIKDIFAGFNDANIIPESTAAFALDFDGNVYAWGANGSGRFGDGTILARSTPTLVVTGKRIVKVAVGNGHTVMLDDQGKVWTMGFNTSGQLGVGDVVARSTPTLMLPVGTNRFMDIGAGTTASYVVDDSGQLYAVGNQSKGQLGNGQNTGAVSSPVAIFAGTILRIAGGGNSNGGEFAIALGRDGAAQGWGMNTVGQNGVGDVTNRSNPSFIAGGFYFGDATPDIFRTIRVIPGAQMQIGTQGLRTYFGNQPLGAITHQRIIIEYNKPDLF